MYKIPRREYLCPHLRSPPTEGHWRQQTQADANSAPRRYLARSLMPSFFHKAIRPPCVEFGCEIDEQHMNKIAEKLGCLNAPEDEPARTTVAYRVKRQVMERLGMRMRSAEVFTGKPNMGKYENITYIYSFLSNYELERHPRSEEHIAEFVDILCAPYSDLKWWVSTTDWSWRCVDLEEERRWHEALERRFACFFEPSPPEQPCTKGNVEEPKGTGPSSTTLEGATV